jgi:hypothetical protein
MKHLLLLGIIVTVPQLAFAQQSDEQSLCGIETYIWGLLHRRSELT